MKQKRLHNMIAVIDIIKERRLNIRELISKGEGRLKEAGIETARLSAERFLEEILTLRRHELYLSGFESIDKEKEKLYFSFIEKRAQHYPFQYITRKSYFMDFSFCINEDCLIPRPETEILIERFLEKIDKAGLAEKPLRVLDMGTGSGNIAVSLVKYLPKAEVTAADISEDALKIARENARLNGVSSGISFLQSDLFCNIQETEFDFIVCNPPYVSGEEMGSLQPELGHEPRLALDGGKEGLEIIQKFINEAPRFLKERGCLFLEIGKGQSLKVNDMLEENFEGIEIFKDYHGIDRVICARKKYLYG